MSSKTLLLVGHAPSPNTARLIKACQQGVQDSGCKTIHFKIKKAQDTQPEDVLEADALILFTTENLSYMSGMVKDFFDRTYYPCLEKTQGLPCAVIVRAGQGGGEGTERALTTIFTGLRWRWVQPALILRGDWQDNFLKQAQELAMGMAVALEEGMI